jgi:hypothetical protein
MSGCDTAAPEADGGEREVAAVLDGDEEGVCYQCDGLRAVCPESKQGPATAGLLAALGTDSLDLPDRMAIVARSGVGRGTSASLHDYLLRFMSERTAAA